MDFVNASASLSAEKAGQAQWEKENAEVDAIGFRLRNPYNVQQAEGIKRKALRILDEKESVHKFAEDTFLEMMD